MGFNCLKATEPLHEDSLLFNIKSPGHPGIHLTDFGKIKGCANFGANQWFWNCDPKIGNRAL